MELTVAPADALWFPPSYSVNAAGPRDAQKEATLQEALDWLRLNDLVPEADLPPAAIKRRFQALSGGRYGPQLSPAQRKRLL